jgi:hypothetical protein
MLNVADIERAIERLSPEELRAFRAWFAERDAAEWDRRLEHDVAGGKLDGIAEEALKELSDGRCTEL